MWELKLSYKELKENLKKENIYINNNKEINKIYNECENVFSDLEEERKLKNVKLNSKDFSEIDDRKENKL